jgi:hypothetical protein
MLIDISKIYQKNFDKIINGINNSNFSLCANLSGDLIRIADDADFVDGVFISEILESLFINIDRIINNFIIEESIVVDLKNALIDSILILKDSFPVDDNKKINIYDSMSNIRAKISKLQLEAFRGEHEKKNVKGFLKNPVGNMNDLSNLIKELE